MAKDKGKKNKASAAPAVSDSDTKIQGVIDRVVNNNKRQPNWSAFSDLVVKNGGPKIKEDHIIVRPPSPKTAWIDASCAGE